LKLKLVRELVTQGQAEGLPRAAASRAKRSLRKWLSKRLSFKLRGSVFRDWAGRFAEDAVGVLDALEAFYGSDAERVAK
jgi:hypothetical protein